MVQSSGEPGEVPTFGAWGQWEPHARRWPARPLDTALGVSQPRRGLPSCPRTDALLLLGKEACDGSSRLHSSAACEAAALTEGRLFLHPKRGLAGWHLRVLRF